jgi:hypothetical protein
MSEVLRQGRDHQAEVTPTLQTVTVHNTDDSFTRILGGGIMKPVGRE